MNQAEQSSVVGPVGFHVAKAPVRLATTLRRAARAGLAAGVGILLLAPVPGKAEPKAHPDTTGWQDLFAPDLSNADMAPGSWVMQDGVLVAKSEETIWTKKSYHNFILDLEFKVAPDANSGVFLRSGNTKDVLAALEVQVHANTDGALYGMVGAIYNAKPPSKPMQKPVGEWNHYTITCRGSHVSLIFNGEEVWNVDLNDWKTPHRNPDGTHNKFAKALKNFARTGPIGLQGLHGRAQAPVWYRNIKIKVLK
jgi:3-keto-disaccharide hydrolase